MLTRIPRLVIAAAVMAAALHFAVDWLALPLSSAASLATRALTLCGLIAAAMAIYFAVAFGTGGASLSMIRRSVKRGAPAPSAERASEGADRQ